MTDLCDKMDCVGCGACRQICPNEALMMVTGADGFPYPALRKERCVDCGLCREVCPILNQSLPARLAEPKAYATWNKDWTTRLLSSSGGIFSVFAEAILTDGGVVYGAVFDATMRLVFKRGESSDDLDAMRGSKYLQADSSEVFKEVANDLKEGRKVLFSGAPCQIAALNAFLRVQGDTEKNPSTNARWEGPENLFTLDFICHGVASPSLWASSVRALEKKYRDHLTVARFRDKANGWKSPSFRYRFSQGRDLFIPWSTLRVWLENAFILIYHHNLSLRASCLQCPFVRLPRPGDLTLADYQTLYHNRAFADKARGGLSLTLINSRRGQRLFDRCADFMTVISRPLAETGVLTATPAKPHPLRNDFLRDAESLDYSGLIQKYNDVLRPRFRLGTAFYAILRHVFGRSLALRLRELLEKARFLR